MVHGGGEDLVGRGVISGYSRGEGEGRHVDCSQEGFNGIVEGDLCSWR